MTLRWYHFIPLSFTMLGYATGETKPTIPSDFRGMWRPAEVTDCTKDNALVIFSNDYSAANSICKVKAVAKFDKVTAIGKAVAVTLECYDTNKTVIAETIRTLIVDKDEMMDVGPEGDIDYYKRCATGE